jgi:hypothetical protein
MTILSEFRGQGVQPMQRPAECAGALDVILKLCLAHPRHALLPAYGRGRRIQSLRAFRRAELRGRSLGDVGALLGVPARQGWVPGGRWGGPVALLGSRGGPREVVGRALGGSGRPWGVPGGAWGGPREAPEAPRGGPGRLRKHMKFSEGVWGGPGAPLG